MTQLRCFAFSRNEKLRGAQMISGFPIASMFFHLKKPRKCHEHVHQRRAENASSRQKIFDKFQSAFEILICLENVPFLKRNLFFEMRTNTFGKLKHWNFTSGRALHLDVSPASLSFACCHTAIFQDFCVHLFPQFDIMADAGAAEALKGLPQ